MDGQEEVGLATEPPSIRSKRAAGDKAMYQNAKKAKTEEAYRMYIYHGKFHVDEMRSAMPRVAFEEVAKKKSVTELRMLLQRYPNAGLQKDVAAEIHALYQHFPFPANPTR